MAEVGAVASIIGIVSFGFSLATQITTYIGDYQDASEDISNLAGEVTTTFRHVEQLQKLIDSEQNTATKAFSDSGLLEAEACKLKARQLADRLWKLVKKSNATFPADGSLSADQLDISIFGKAKWPRFKPRVEQHKHELVVLNTNILICMVGYRLESGAPPADQVRATEELDRLKRSKKLALHSLREAQKRRKRKKVKSVDDRRPHFSDDERPPIRQGSGNSYATPLYPRRPSRAASYDDYYRDGDSWLPDEAFIDQLEEDLRKDILLQMEEDKVVKEMAERKAEEERVAAVAKYKEDLVKKLNQSSQTAEDLKRALVKTFPARVSENSVTRFVEEQRQADAVKDDEVAQLMRELIVRSELVVHRGVETAAVPEATSSARSSATKHRGRRQAALALAVREYADWRRAKRLRKRTRILDITTFSVIVSVDGDRHRASLVNVPTPWTDKLLAEQEKKGWWKGASFKETLHTYARLDLQSRNVAEDEADRQGVDSGQLVLLYARMLDKNISKGRKLLDAMMMASDPWEYFHGRALLIYKVSGGGQSHRYDEESTTTDSYASGPRLPGRSRSRRPLRNPSPMHYGDGVDYYGDLENPTKSRPKRRSRSRSRSRSSDARNGRYDTDEDGGYRPDRERSNRHYDSNAREGRQKSEEQAAYRDEVDYRVEPDFERSHVQDRHSKRGPYKGSHTYVAPRYPIAPDALAPRVDEYAFRHVPSGYPEGHRPTYARVQRKYMSTETLAYYSIPYEVDRDDPDYFILLRDIDQYEIDVLFEHSRRTLRFSPARSPERESHDRSSKKSHNHESRMRSPPDYDSARAPVVNLFNGSYEDRSNGHAHPSRSRSGMASPPSRLHPFRDTYAAMPGPSVRGHSGAYKEQRHLRDEERPRERPRLYRVEAKTEWEDDERHERNVGMEKVETEAEVEQMYPREWRTTKDEEADADAGRKLRQRDEPIRRRSAGPVYDERGRPIEIEEDRRERDDRHYAWDRERDPSITKSRDARYIIVERKDDERTLGYRPVSALSASRSSHLHTVGGRSRLRSRARAYDRRLEAQSVAEEGGDQQDSPSDLFESEMSEEDSGDEKAAGKRLVRAGKQRERGSGASSVLGLESTVRTESPSSLSDSQEVQPVPRITPSSRGSRGSYLFGYVRPYAETVTDYEPSRHNPAESARVPGRSLAEGDPSQVPEVRVIGHNETTDDEAVYQTAVESHGIDDYNEVVVGGPDEAVRDETTHGTGADQHGDAARHPEVFHDNEEPLARAADGPVIVEEVD